MKYEMIDCLGKSFAYNDSFSSILHQIKLFQIEKVEKININFYINF